MIGLCMHSVSTFPNHVFLMNNDSKLLYTDSIKLCDQLGSFLIYECGLKSVIKKQEKIHSENLVGILLSNGSNWILSDFACINYSLVSIPLSATLESHQLISILKQTNVSTLITDVKLMEKILNLTSFSSLSVRYTFYKNYMV